MKKLSHICYIVLLACFMVSGFMVGQANAHHVEGNVYCDANGILVPLAGITVNTTNGIQRSSITDSSGYYYHSLTEGGFPVTYTQTLGGVPSDVTYIDPSGDTVEFDITDSNRNAVVDWIIDSQEIPECAELVKNECWLTAGGVKFVREINTLLAEHGGPRDNVGGVVYAGCNPDAGEGGNWNHLEHKAKQHLKGTELTVLECGCSDLSVAPGEPCSESPVTPVNWIEFVGNGTLVEGSGNNKTETEVSFFVRAEDWNEPGGDNPNSNSGADSDRYFLNVYTDAGDQIGTSVLLFDEDGDPATVDPWTITGGNFQIHDKPCDNR